MPQDRLINDRINGGRGLREKLDVYIGKRTGRATVTVARH